MPVRERNPMIEETRDFPDSRGQTILSAVINEHFVTGEPVGSKTIAERFANAPGLSSATIRSVMAELEELGLLEHPHTSAGRVPTDKGYRYYVDNLLGVLSISNEDLGQIGSELGLSEGELLETPDRLMERTSQLLSVLSNNVGIVVSPSLASDRLQHIEFVSLSDNRILVILVSAPNIVHNRIIRLNVTFSKEAQAQQALKQAELQVRFRIEMAKIQAEAAKTRATIQSKEELERCANYLNAEHAGKSLSEIRNEILKLMHDERSLFDRLLQTAVILCSQSIEDEDLSAGEVFFPGDRENPDQKGFC